MTTLYHNKESNPRQPPHPHTFPLIHTPSIPLQFGPWHATMHAPDQVPVPALRWGGDGGSAPWADPNIPGSFVRTTQPPPPESSSPLPPLKVCGGRV